MAAERHRGRYAGVDDASSRQRVQAAAGQASAASPDRPAASDGTGDRDTRRGDPGAPRDAAGRRRQPRPDPRGARAQGPNSTTPWSCSRATTATSTASTGSTRSAGSRTKRASASRSIIRYPRMATAGSTPGQMALSLDVAPTLLEMAGLRPGADIQGRSLVPVLTQRGASLALVVPGRVLLRHRVPAGPEHGLRGRAHRSGTSTSSTGNSRGWTSSTISTPIPTKRPTSSTDPGSRATAAADAVRVAEPARADQVSRQIPTQGWLSAPSTTATRRAGPPAAACVPPSARPRAGRSSRP